MHLQFQLKTLKFMFLYTPRSITAALSCLFHQYPVYEFLADEPLSPLMTFRHIFFMINKIVIVSCIYLKHGLYNRGYCPTFLI